MWRDRLDLDLELDMELDSNNKCGMCSVLQGDGAGGAVQAAGPSEGGGATETTRPADWSGGETEGEPGAGPALPQGLQ